jgi:hypothetical protein
VVEAMNQRTDAISREVRDKQATPVAGIWSCPNCGRHIQEIIEGSLPKKQAYVCVCGTSMVPGEEHVEVDAASSENQPEAPH